MQIPELRSRRNGVLLPPSSSLRSGPLRAARRPSALQRLKWSWAHVVGVVVVALVAFLMRAVLGLQHSAYMDEGGQILIGRGLIEQRTVYADALNWSYGSYLWPLVAAAADMAGGLVAARLVTAALGAVMAVATTFTALRLIRPDASAYRWSAALIAGLIMAVFPTAVGIGRIATYDALAGAAMMSGIALLVPGARWSGRRALLGGAALLFTAFLAKYVVALYFPFICLYLFFGPRNLRIAVRNVVWFMLPLAAACAAYFLLFHQNLFALLAFSVTYHDLRSANPLYEYVGQRLDLWALALVAACGWRSASGHGRRIALGGVAIMLVFHSIARPDYDFWKHSIYLIYFLAPLAGLALAPLTQQLLSLLLAGLGWRPSTGTERVVAIGLVAAAVVLQLNLWTGVRLWWPAALLVLVLAPLAGLTLISLAQRTLALQPNAATGQHSRRPWRAVGITLLVAALVAPIPLARSMQHADRLVTFYPDLNPALPAIRAETEGARTLLTDDTTLRYYLASQLRYGRITDPFYIDYEGHQGIEAYRLAIKDRLYDAIVLDGGIGPVAGQIRSELGEEIARSYELVYSRTSSTGAPIEIYHPRLQAETSAGSRVYRFGSGLETWGGRAQGRMVEPRLQMNPSEEHPWAGQPSYRFTVTADTPFAGVSVVGPVSKVVAQIYIEPLVNSDAEIPVGVAGFDWNWQWHDDGFHTFVVPGRWTQVTWQLSDPGVYREIGFQFDSQHIRTAYIGQVEIQP